MRVLCARYFTSLLVLVALAVVLVPVSASLFSMPKFDMDQFSFGSSQDQPGTTTKIDKSIAPFNDLSLSSGIGMPVFGGLNSFYSPVTSQRSYTKTVMTPEGPKTQMMYQSYDGKTGERATTVTNI